MSAGKHTPGPWRRHKADMFGDINIDNGVITAVIGVAISNLRPSDEVEANANLLTSAPDLLAASKAAINIIGRLVPTKEGVSAYDALKAAIAKAEGR